MEKYREITPTPELQISNIETKEIHPKVIGIYTSEAMGLPMQRHMAIKAILGIGLEGDRYANREGAYSVGRRIPKKPPRIPDEDRQVTLITIDGIHQANLLLAEKSITPFMQEETRRNIVIGNLSYSRLNELVGRFILVGKVKMEVVELCEPCNRPAVVIGRKEVGKDFEQAFQDKGGVRARIITDGNIFINDLLTMLP